MTNLESMTDAAIRLTEELAAAKSEIESFKANNRYQRGYHDGEQSTLPKVGEAEHLRIWNEMMDIYDVYDGNFVHLPIARLRKYWHKATGLLPPER